MKYERVVSPEQFDALEERVAKLEAAAPRQAVIYHGDELRRLLGIPERDADEAPE